LSGDDTYVYAKAGGDDVIDDASGSGNDRLVFTDINPGDVTLERNRAGVDLIMSIAGGASLLIRNEFNGWGAIETVQFANTFTKTFALTKMIKNYNLKRPETYHVGNEILDMRSAAAVGIKGVATTWGGFNPDRLKRIEPFAIIDKPSELVRLLQ